MKRAAEFVAGFVAAGFSPRNTRSRADARAKARGYGPGIVAFASVAGLLFSHAAAQPPGGHPPIEPPKPPEATEVNRDLLKHVEDDAPVRGENENADEARAYDYLVNFARKVPIESFQKHARRDITIGHLLAKDCFQYRGEVVHIDGHLKRVREFPPTPALAADGVEKIYEGWIFSDLYRDHGFCVIITELPTGLDVSESLDRRASFDGYFFKQYRYQAVDATRRAPLLIGRTISLGSNNSAGSNGSVWEIPVAVLPAIVGIVGIALAAMIFLVTWYRRSDQFTRDRLARARLQPPAFDGESPGESTNED